MAEVRMKARHRVEPAAKTWRGTKELAETDMAVQDIFMPLLYFYPPTADNDHRHQVSPPSVVEKLKAALSAALVHFYPFAGRLRPGGGGRAALECDEAASWVLLLEAEEISGVRVAGLVVDLPEAAAWVELFRFQNLIPVVDQTTTPLHELPLFSAQLTHFRCGGSTLGFRFAHAVADGRGMGHFLTQWARLARGEPLEMEPVHDRTLMRAGQPPRAISSPTPAAPSPPPADGDGRRPPSSSGEVALLNLFVSKLQVDKLKEAAGAVSDGRSYSRFEVLAAQLWRCLEKTRVPEGDKVSVVSFSVDIRKRTEPPLPPAYCGNAVITVLATSEHSRLVSSPLGHACEKIREAINNVTDEYVWTYVDHLKSKADLGGWLGLILTPAGHPLRPDLMLTSWLVLPIYGLDFGSGKEARMAGWAPPLAGAGCLMPGREEGSAVLPICLELSRVDMFKKYFYGELI